MSNKTPSPIKSSLVIAYNTFLESIRNRVLLVALIFAIILVGLSVAAASVSFGARARLIMDVGLAAGSALGSIIAIALTISSFGGEIKKRTAYTVLVRPMPRWSFILGKFVGLAATMTIVISLMLLATAGIVISQGEGIPNAFWASLWLNLVESWIVIALSLFFSTIAIPVLAATYTAGVILGGNLAGDILIFVRTAATKGMANTEVFEFLYYLLPDLQNLSLRSQAANDMAVPMGFLTHGTLYGFCYASTMLIAAMWVFSFRKTL